MPKKTAPSDIIQSKALAKVEAVSSTFSSLLSSYRRLWLDLFEATYVFETKNRNAQGQSQIFFAKCYEQIEKVAPRLTGNSPKFVLGMNIAVHPDNPETDMLLTAQANQAALNYYWVIGNNQSKLRSWAKSGLLYGVAFAKVKFIQQTHKSEKKTMIDYETERTTEKEELLLEYPTFEVLDNMNVLFDPRIEHVDDYDAFIETETNVRKSDILSKKDLYFNLDKLEQINTNEHDPYIDNKFSLQGISSTDVEDDQKLTVRTYWGYFCEPNAHGEQDPEDEKLYKITTVNGSTMIGYECIDFIPIEKWVPSEIPNQGVGKGIIEPIKKLQDAYNLTRNQRYENISLIINRMWLMKIGAGVDPRKLVSRAGNIIPVRDLDALAPVPMQDVTQSSFEETNSLNTEIQTTLGTIDTTQDNGSNGFTNLATGQKIRWNEYNTRFKAIKDNLEEALARLGRKMLMMVAERAEQNPKIQDPQTRQFYEVAKTAFDSVADFYNVSVLVDSTSSDSIENKRDEALAFGQLAIAYKAQGVNIPMDVVWQDIVESFPGKDAKVYAPPPQPPQDPSQMQEQQPGGSPVSQAVIDQAQVQSSPEDQLNQSLTNV